MVMITRLRIGENGLTMQVFEGCYSFFYLLRPRAKPWGLPSFIENGAPPHLLGAVRPPPLRCCFVCILIGICVQLHGGNSPAPSQGLEGIMIRCIGIAYAR